MKIRKIDRETSKLLSGWLRRFFSCKKGQHGDEHTYTINCNKIKLIAKDKPVEVDDLRVAVEEKQHRSFCDCIIAKAPLAPVPSLSPANCPQATLQCHHVQGPLDASVFLIRNGLVLFIHSNHLSLSTGPQPSKQHKAWLLKSLRTAESGWSWDPDSTNPERATYCFTYRQPQTRHALHFCVWLCLRVPLKPISSFDTRDIYVKPSDGSIQDPWRQRAKTELKPFMDFEHWKAVLKK